VKNISNCNKNNFRAKVVKEFYKIVFPDSLPEAEEQSVYVRSILADLDNDKKPEILVLFGVDEFNLILGVLQKQGNQWYLVYCEPIFARNTDPDLAVATTSSGGRIFHILDLRDRGSGVFCDLKYFYKLINSHVYKCLTVINRAYINGWGLLVDQEVLSKSKIKNTEDIIEINYEYSFKPGYSWDSNIRSTLDSISFVEGKESIPYVWNNSSYTYEPLFNNIDSSALNVEKIKCFGDFGNDSLFASAFSFEIGVKLKTGSPIEVKLLNEFLNSLKEAVKED
jgi:hypothetical protein